ncbi:hypothetical protein CK203_072903 [Vitis vinifera]|uniref:Uncharacterized protein n=1 Tax=Vitis vinifera TaxID=29760 RepID=A0A438DM49_VITVI|nr:hypothetical protein CK203_072903 [Vitis vinifera]
MFRSLMEQIFSDWSEQVQFHLGVLDLDLALRTEKPPAITEETNNINSTLPEHDTAKEFLRLFDGTRGMHEHILEMSNLAAKLKALGMNVDESFLIQFILNSFPLQYGPFQIHYNTIKDKWNVNELASMPVQEETRLKQQGHHSIHLISKGASKKWKKPKKGRMAKGQNHLRSWASSRNKGS